MLLDKYRDKVSLSMVELEVPEIGDKIKCCSCFTSEIGKIKIDSAEHLPGCRLKKKATREINNGYSLVVAP